MKRIILLISILISISLKSQILNELLDKKVDIEIDNGELYISPNMIGILSGITFTSRNSVDYTFVSSETISIFQSGESVIHNGFIYKTYVGFGSLSMNLINKTILGKFSNKNVEIVEDDFSRSANGDYYLSVNGIDISGDIKMSRIPFDGNIKIFPNPFGSEVSINTSENTHIQIYNIVGKLEIDQVISDGIINTSNLSPGSYLIRIVNDFGSIDIIGIKSN